MLSERPWKLEAVLALLAGLVVGWSALNLSAIGVTQLALHKNSPNRLFEFIISSFSFYIVALVLIHFFLRFHGATWNDLFGFRKLRWQSIAAALAAAVIFLPAGLTLKKLSAVLLTKVGLNPVEQTSMQALELSVSLGQKIVFGIAALLMAPIVEESLFRGILYPVVKQQGYPKLALFGSSVAFAAIHTNLVTFLPLFLLALVFVFLLEITDALLAPVIAHSCFNGINFAVYVTGTDVMDWWKGLMRAIRHALPSVQHLVETLCPALCRILLP